MSRYIPKRYDLFLPNSEYLGTCYVIYNTLIIEVAWTMIWSTTWTIHSEKENALHLYNVLSTLPIQESFERVIVFCVLDEHVSSEIIRAVNKCATDSFPDKFVLTLYNCCKQQAPELVLPTNNNASLGINYFGAVTKHVVDHNFTWNPQHRKAFWLVGKPTKHDRLSLLYYLIQSGIVSEYVTYSYNPEYCSFGLDPYKQGQDIIDSVWYPGHPGTVNYRTWAMEHTNEIGDVKLGKNQYNGVVYDLEIYRSHCCEVITETFFDQPRYLTEKIHRSISLGYPFLILGDHFEEYLKSLGYRTFGDMLGMSELGYTQQGYLQLSCKKMAKLIIQFCERCKDPVFEQQVRENIDHNKRLLESRIALTIEHASRYNPEFAAILDYKCRLHVGENPAIG